MTTQYATKTDLQMLGLSERALSGVTDAAIDAALVAASATADSYLTGRYGASLPLVSWPESLRHAVAALAAMTILSSIGFNPENGSHVIVARRHDDAIKWLRDVSTGMATLPAYTSSPRPALAPAAVSLPAEEW